MKCKICNGTGIIAKKGYDDYEPFPCDCTIDPRDLGEE